MKKPITAIFNDVHIKFGNEDEVIRSVKHMVKYLVKNNIKEIICNGDVFDNRSHQRLSCLDTWTHILDLFKKNGIFCHTNVGNHEKTLYSSKKSFLDTYKTHPSIKVYDEISTVKIGGFNMTFSPFFSDEILVPMLEEHEGSDVLIGHWEMEGSSHLGKVSEKTTINKKLLSKWKKVYLGHYHNHQEITKNIVHLPSLRQDGFGEDSNKGFSIIYDDLSYDIIEGDFDKFTKIELNVEEIDTKELKKIIKTHSGSKDTVRIEISGDESKVKAIDKNIFKGTGIDFKPKYNIKYEYDDSDSKKPNITESYSKDDIIKMFRNFCDEKCISEADFGESLLNEFLNK